jgi:hypothetical protein
MMKCWQVVAAGLVMALMLSGCRSGGEKKTAPSEDQRRAELEQRRMLEQLRLQLAQMELRLQALRREKELVARRELPPISPAKVATSERRIIEQLAAIDAQMADLLNQKKQIDARIEQLRKQQRKLLAQIGISELPWYKSGGAAEAARQALEDEAERVRLLQEIEKLKRRYPELTY